MKNSIPNKGKETEFKQGEKEPILTNLNLLDELREEEMSKS